MDKIDLGILKILKKNARTPYIKIAKIVGLTEGAIRRRVKIMLSEGIIAKFTIETASKTEGIVLIKTDPLKTEKVSLGLKKFSEKIFEISGDYDIAAFINSESIEELNEKIDEIRGIDGILNTNTLIKLTNRVG